MSTRILVVEDHALTSQGLKRELTALGHEVVGVVGNAQDAVKAAAELKPQLILMDIGLAGSIDGITAASAIRGFDSIPVIFLTAYSDNETLDRAMQVSPFGYIVKPFERHEMEAAISLALSKHQKESQGRQGM